MSYSGLRYTPKTGQVVASVYTIDQLRAQYNGGSNAPKGEATVICVTGGTVSQAEQGYRAATAKFTAAQVIGAIQAKLNEMEAKRQAELAKLVLKQQMDAARADVSWYADRVNSINSSLQYKRQRVADLRADYNDYIRKANANYDYISDYNYYIRRANSATDSINYYVDEINDQQREYNVAMQSYNTARQNFFKKFGQWP